MSTNGFNQQKAEAFAGQVLGILNNGALALMTSVGHRTGLFNTLATLPPATSSQIANAANLQERYVREWLASMVTGRIVEYDPEEQTYRLPPEHAAFLSSVAAINNLAMKSQFIPLLGRVEDEMVEVFRQGGGVPYAAYPRFQEVMAENSYQSVATPLLERTLPAIPGLTEKLQQGIDVLEVGSGQGRVLNLLGQTFPNSRFTGYDFSEEGITTAQAEVKQLGLSNVHFEVKDVALIDAVGQYDLILAFDAIHDQAHPARVLQNISTALRPDGTFLMQDIASSSYVHKNLDHPAAPLLYTISCMHCTTVSLAQGGEGLGTMWGEEKALEMLAEAGFGNVVVKKFPYDFINNYYICTKA